MKFSVISIYITNTIIYRIDAKINLQIFLVENQMNNDGWLNFTSTSFPHCVSVHLQFSSSTVTITAVGRRRISFYLQDSPRYFPLPVNWTITFVALIPQKRVFARIAYFLAHLLFGSSFTLRLHFSSFLVMFLFLLSVFIYLT